MRVGKAAFDDLDLRHRGGVKMADARGPHLLQNQGRRIGLDGIERVAGKTVEEAARCGGEFFGENAIDRLARLHHRDGFFDGAEARHGVDARGCVHAMRPCCSASLRQWGVGVKKYRARRAVDAIARAAHSARMRRFMARWTSRALALALVLLAPLPALGATVTVFAAASLSEALSDVAAACQRQTGSAPAL